MGTRVWGWRRLALGEVCLVDEKVHVEYKHDTGSTIANDDFEVIVHSVRSICVSSHSNRYDEGTDNRPRLMSQYLFSPNLRPQLVILHKYD